MTPGFSRPLAFAALCLFALPAAAQVVFDREGNVVERALPPGVTAPDPITHTADPRWGGCVPNVTGDPDVELRQSVVGGRVVDPCGHGTRSDGSVISDGADEGSVVPNGSFRFATIDRMTTRSWRNQYVVGGDIGLLGQAVTYFLNDGSQWDSGAGSAYHHGALLDRVEVQGSTVRYVLQPAETGLIYQQTDYDAGDHSAQGTLGAAGDLILEAEIGTNVAVLRGAARIVANDATWYSVPRFNYYSAMVGSTVPFEVVVTLTGASWTPTTFDSSFSYQADGWVDFANPLTTPTPVEVSIYGPARVADESTMQYAARLRYDTGQLRDVTREAIWSVAPDASASIAQGLLSVGTLARPEQMLVLGATLTEGGISVTGQKQVRALRDLYAEAANAWPMYQADARHSGYVADTLQPNRFKLRWQRALGGPGGLNPVAAADGKVFVSQVRYFEPGTSLFALDAAGGETRWSIDFGSVFSVNPPSFGYGNVYIQTGNHSSDTWLHALDGETGEVVFKKPHLAQWERYLAPTLLDYNVLINGGYYGGMYSFNALSGEQQWFLDLPQYDQWTPAAASTRAFAHVGEYQPGLYSVDAYTGQAPERIDDTEFDWNGWSMGVAPAVAENGDVISIHNGRLINFDAGNGTIRWQQQAQFAGQPSVAHGRIYAVNGGRLVVLDQLTQTEVWSWQPEAPGIRAPLVVTDSHVLISTGSQVHAIDQQSRTSVWSYPAAGHLALANDTLYIAGDDGTLTAIGIRNMDVFTDGFESAGLE